MGRFTKGRELLSGRAKHSQALTDTPFPVTEDPRPYRGSFIITESGQMQWSNGEEWVPLAPRGTEMMIPPWVDVPEGWFEVSGKFEGDFANRRVIANLFDFGYVEENLVSWLLPIPANMYETSAAQAQVGGPPTPVGYIIDSSLPRVDWTQPVSGSRPVWRQVIRDSEIVDQITFNQIGQKFELSFPERVQGTMIVCTEKGIISQTVDIMPGAYSYGRWELFPVEEILIFNKFLTATELSAFEEFLVLERKKIRNEFATVTNMRRAFLGRSELTSVHLTETQNVLYFGGSGGSGCFKDCTALQNVSVDTSGCLDFEEMFRNTPSLGFGPNIDTSSGRDFRAMFSGSGITGLPDYDLSGGSVVNTSIVEFTKGCSNLLSWNTNIILPDVDNWSHVWYGCSSLDNKGDSNSGWSFPILDSSGVVTMHTSWRDCSSLQNFPPLDTSSVEIFFETWFGCTSINNMVNHGTTGGDPESFPRLDMSSATNCFATWKNCASLTSFPPMDFSSVVGSSWPAYAGFRATWKDCTSLLNFPANQFNNSNCINYDQAFNNCSLSTSSVNNILTSIAAAAVTFDLNNGVLGMGGGTSAAPTGAGLAAKNDLIARGWSVATN